MLPKDESFGDDELVEARRRLRELHARLEGKRRPVKTMPRKPLSYGEDTQKFDCPWGTLY